MNTKDILRQLRVQKGLSQDELAEKLYVTRQAVSRWETGETTPNVETLKLLSHFFDVSINTLLGTPRALVCQCCGMPLDDASLSRELDGAFPCSSTGNNKTRGRRPTQERLPLVLFRAVAEQPNLETQ